MKEFYTPPEAAAEILGERREDPAIRARVLQYLGDMLPSAALEQDKPVAILARYVPRATAEDRQFAKVAQEAGFTPFWASYLNERFTNRNPEKVEIIRPPTLWKLNLPGLKPRVSP